MKIKNYVPEEIKPTPKQTKKINVTVKGDEIIFGDENSFEKTSISFQRTLRIPDDKKIYPLPPSLGPFPIEKVDDYLDKVPESWKAHGGVFIPMYQREAMWMKFNGVKNDPKAVKVAIGKVNALSGKTWDQSLKNGENDYVVIPEQPWLDGINAGDGTVRQFVAMPLGGGYTVEGQVTGKEEFGGIQLCVYDSKVEKPKKEEEIMKYPEYSFIEHEIQPYIVPKIPKNKKGIVPMQMNQLQPSLQSMQMQPQSSMTTGSSYPMQPENLMSMMDSCESDDFSFSESAPSSSMMKKKKSAPVKEMEKDSFVEERSTFSEAKEMGLASGGRMKQKIYKDQYGVNYWDETNYGRVFVHIVNSAMYSKITGKSLPETPISAQTYADYGYAWYDIWDEGKSSIKKSEILSNVKSVKEIDQQKFGYSNQNDSSIKINHIVKLKQKDEIRDGNW
jgi:hypothetical protein